jgi:polysaccharide biosynthesis/export protein
MYGYKILKLSFMKPVYNSVMRCGRVVLVTLALVSITSPMTLELIAQASDPPTAPPSGNDVPVPVGYIVGEADVLRVNVWKQPEISQQSVVVRPDGKISVPLVGELKVSGMTPVQIETILVTDLKEYVNEPRVTVTVLEVGSKTVYVTGEVQHPGAYPLVGPVDILQMIAKAGGVTPYAHRRSVFVLREVNGKKQKLPVDYSRIFHGKNVEQNISLQPGDTIVVP